MELQNIKTYLNSLEKPFCLFLIGPPLSGKDTFISNLDLNDVTIISRDDIIIDLSEGMNYNEAFRTVNQKHADKILKDRIRVASNSSKSVIINLTNLRRKKRVNFINKFKDKFTTIALIFPFLSIEEYKNRNIKRTNEENKTISLNVIKDMISGFEPINNSENFDKVINLKN